MALSTLWKLGKFKALARALKGKAQAVGTLECLWACGCQAADDFLGTAEDVEAECEWKGKRGALAKTLEDLHWIDATPRGYIIHDFWDHCPGYVKRKRARLDLEHNKGRTEDGQRTYKGRTPNVPRGVEGSGGEYPPYPPEGARVERTPCGAGSQAPLLEQPEQPFADQEPPVDIGALVAGIFPRHREQPPDPEERRVELERQKRELLAGAGNGGTP